jgi:carboxynorspermidine decarboxylase
MRKYISGTTSSSLNELRLGKEMFGGGETHAYSVAWSDEDMKEVPKYADKIIFNSISQLNRYYKKVKGKVEGIGLRVNPKLSFSHYDLADPNREYSRLGVFNKKDIEAHMDKINGFMFHFNCENKDFDEFRRMLNCISWNYSHPLKRLSWVSLGGGIGFTSKNYPIKELSQLLKEFSRRHNVQVYLEPGEAAITNSTSLVTSVLDIVRRDGKQIAIVDSSVEAHMLDHLIYKTSPKVEDQNFIEGHEYIVAGKTCLAGDEFGKYLFNWKLEIGDKITFLDVGGYSMVKANWFNGIDRPSIAIKRLNKKIDLIRKFSYNDYIGNLK